MSINLRGGLHCLMLYIFNERDTSRLVSCQGILCTMSTRVMVLYPGLQTAECLDHNQFGKMRFLGYVEHMRPSCQNDCVWYSVVQSKFNFHIFLIYMQMVLTGLAQRSERARVLNGTDFRRQMTSQVGTPVRYSKRSIGATQRKSVNIC